MPKLFMILLGCTPKGRNIEQHDVFFGIADQLHDLIAEMNAFWPEAEGRIHIDAFREVRQVGHLLVKVEERKKAPAGTAENSLFFLNLGGYQPNVFEELHYKMLVVASTKAEAIREAKDTAFYLHTGFKGANSHIDDKYGVDVDDVFEIEDILSPETRAKYRLAFEISPSATEDPFFLGYLPISKIKIS